MIILNLVNILLFYSLLFKVVSLFLGVLISDMNLGTNGWGVMIGWTIWILALPFILEIFKFLESSDKKSNILITFLKL